MTDEELIARLRSGLIGVDVDKQAADRIEALVKEKQQLGRELNTARYGQPDFAWAMHKEAMAELQARAERLEEALQWCSGSDDFQEGGKAREGWLKLCAPLLIGEGRA